MGILTVRTVCCVAQKAAGFWEWLLNITVNEVFFSDSYLTPHSRSSPLRIYMAIRESSLFILAKATTGRVPVSGIQFPTVNQALHL